MNGRGNPKLLPMQPFFIDFISSLKFPKGFNNVGKQGIGHWLKYSYGHKGNPLFGINGNGKLSVTPGVIPELTAGCLQRPLSKANIEGKVRFYLM